MAEGRPYHYAAAITAYDLNTGKILLWQTPSDTPQAGPGYQRRGNITPRSGFVVTCCLRITSLYALDKNTGKGGYSREAPKGGGDSGSGQRGQWPL